MLSILESAFVVIAAVFLASVLLSILQRIWPRDLRGQHNDLIGWHVSVLGSTYAVIIGFMLFAVWTNFETADTNAETEANCLVNLARSSRALPHEQHLQILRLAREYAKQMVGAEWQVMDRHEANPSSQILVRQLWEVLASVNPQTNQESVSLDHAYGNLERMTEYRRLRLIQVGAQLPPVLWFVLILGAVLTVTSACLFGSSNFRLHWVQVMTLTLMISSVLMAIGDINDPFQGALHVEPNGFVRAQQTLNETP